MKSPIVFQSKAKFIALALLVASPNFMLCAVETTATLSSTSGSTLGSTPGSESGSDTSPVSDLVITFNDSYKAYKQAVADNNDAEILKFSSQAYSLGKQEFGDKSIDTVNLGLNYAAALSQEDKTLDENQAKQRKAEAHQLYLDALAVYEVEYGDESVESIDPLLGAAQTNSDIKKAKSQFKQAVDIAEDSERPMLLASVQMSAFDGLKKSKYYDRRVRNYALSAFEIYEENLPEDSILRLETTFTVALISMVEGKNTKAIPLFETVVEQFSKLDYSHPYELVSHARLVELYESKGDSESSTKHCIAIGSMSPWLDDQEQQALYRKEPRYPMSAARSGMEGWVQITFTVDEYGFVTEPKVLHSKGGAGFEKSSLKALKKWRYAPKFVDGKAVTAESLVQLDFTLSRR